MNRFFLLLPLIFAKCTFAEDAFEFKFGLLADNENRYQMLEETLSIPYITLNEGQRFGFIIFTDNNKYKFQSVLYLPSEPKNLSGDMLGQNSSSWSIGIKSPIYDLSGEKVQVMWLDKGDPQGEYKLELFIDGKLLKVIQFIVGR